ncbi:hypothetical protein BC628DRAFT_1396185 [Trametes gibbosa]|nr:hypothetical protein BC628DRAFT_1396185 [Trametes gibbosa]
MHTHVLRARVPGLLVELLVSLLYLSHILPQVTVSIQLVPSCGPSLVFSTGIWKHQIDVVGTGLVVNIKYQVLETAKPLAQEILALCLVLFDASHQFIAEIAVRENGIVW